MKTPQYALALLLCLFSLIPRALAAEPAFELRPNDRVVLLGDGLIEQAQYAGWLEVMLATAFPDSDAPFRNLGWNGDTPFGASRFGLSLLQAGREPADEGWKQLQKQLELTQPTVLVLGYGMASRLEEGVSGLPKFEAEFQQLLEYARTVNPEVRFVVFSPIRQLNAQAEVREAEAAYVSRLAGIAKKNDAIFVDLSDAVSAPELRKDPIHLNDAGYKALAEFVRQKLQLPDSDWTTSPHTEPLRQVILRKNEWWFHRSRPANMAYVFGFRKHEQGQNAQEIPQFDQLVAEEESRIRRLVALDGMGAKSPPAKLESSYAKFVEQPIPEFSIDDEFEVTLWAQNPDLNKPIHMNFDAQGRLWVASSEAYPMIEVGQSAPDRVIVLEDSDNDGKADRSSVFAEGLLIPTGIAPGDGGVYVAQSTDLLHLKDTNGDGKADVKRRVLSGFGTEDTHHNLHTLRWGLDGKLYMNQSVYTRTDAETPHGVVRLKAGGGLRLDTQTLKMDIFFRGLWNSWGHQFDAYGQSFLTDGAGFAGVAYSFPGATFRPSPGSRQQLGLISPGNWPKFASLEIIQGDSFPEDWQGSLVTCDFRANRVTRFSLTEQDAGFVTTQEADLLRSSSTTFRPIDVKQGPDGALYIADWSNPIINHGEVDFRDERRDRWHGRIWRVSWKKNKSNHPTDLTQFDNKALMNLLLTNDHNVRERARRLLLEGDLSEQEVAAWLPNQDGEMAQLQGLWLYQGIGKTNIALAQALLNSEDHRVRSAVVRVLADWYAASGTLELLEQCIQDSHPRVRLETIRAFAKYGDKEFTTKALACLDYPMDRFLDHALRLTVQEQEAPLMQALADGNLELSAQQLEYVLPVVQPNLASSFLAAKIDVDGIPADGSGPWIELIGKAGGPTELKTLLQLATSGHFQEQATQRALRALSQAERLRRTRPPLKNSGLKSVILSANPGIQKLGIELAGIWKLRHLQPTLLEFAVSDETSDDVRIAAIQALQQVWNSKVSEAPFKELANDSDNSTTVRIAALRSQLALDAPSSVEPLFALLKQQSTEEGCRQVWQAAIGSNKDFGNMLASRSELENLPEFAIMAGIRVCQSTGNRNQSLLAKLQKLTINRTVQMSAAEMKALAEEAATKGDPIAGELVYRRQDLACATCHAIGGAGGKVGPDMTSLGASAPIDYLVESLFDPNAKIKEGYHSITVLTEDDQVVSGIPQPESNEERIVLRDANGKQITIPRVDVVTQKPGQSLMPKGVVDRLSQKEQINLVAFLSKLGKPGRFDASDSRIARSFEIFAGTHRREQQGVDKIINGEIPGWLPYLSLANGNIPRAELLAATKQPVNISLVHIYLKTAIEVSERKEVILFAEHGAAIWIDERRIDSKELTDAEQFKTRLDAGKHEVILRLDARDLPEATGLTSPNAAFVEP